MWQPSKIDFPDVQEMVRFHYQYSAVNDSYLASKPMTNSIARNWPSSRNGRALYAGSNFESQHIGYGIRWSALDIV
jgi:hypothetical protein